MFMDYAPGPPDPLGQLTEEKLEIQENKVNDAPGEQENKRYYVTQ